LNYIDKLI